MDYAYLRIEVTVSDDGILCDHRCKFFGNRPGRPACSLFNKTLGETFEGQYIRCDACICSDLKYEKD